MEVTHKQLKQLLFKGYETKVPIDVKGAPGIGKSEIIQDVAKEIATKEKKEFIFWNELPEDKKESMVTKDMTKYFIYADMRLAQMDQTDLKGFPKTEDSFAKWLPTLLFKVLSNPDSKGLIFFDEMNLAVPSVVASAYSIVNDHLIGETPISKGVYIVSAGNRLSDTNNAFDDPAPLNNRRMNVVLNPPKVSSKDGDDWTSWATSHDIDMRIIGYLNAFENKLFKYEEDNKDASFPSPRTWAKASAMIKEEKDLNLIKSYVGSLVGEGIASEFKAFLSTYQKVNVRDILKNPSKMQQYQNDKLDLKYAIVTGVAELYGKEKKILNDAMALCPYMEPEFSMFMLRLMKSLSKSNFATEITACSNWKNISTEFAKYLL